MDGLDKNFEYFISNHDKILKEHPNQFVVIQDCKVVASASSFDGALAKTEEMGLELGTFLIQECTAGTAAYTQTFHSRVIFA